MKTLLFCSDCTKVKEEQGDWGYITPQIKVKIARNYYIKLKYICPKCREKYTNPFLKPFHTFKQNLSNLLNQKFK
jgi:hypothetical protein